AARRGCADRTGRAVQRAGAAGQPGRVRRAGGARRADVAHRRRGRAVAAAHPGPAAGRGRRRRSHAGDLPGRAAARGGHRGAEGPEFGPALAAKRDVAAGDPLFGPVPFTPDVVQWHGEGVSVLPPGAVLLASSPRYPNQAFRVGEAAWGLQFHIETTPQLVKGWAEADADRLAEHHVDPNRILARLDEEHEDLAAVWQPFTMRFAELIQRKTYRRRG